MGMDVVFNDSFRNRTRNLFLSTILENRTVGCSSTLGGRAGEEARSVMRILSSNLHFSFTLQTATYSLPAGMTRGPGPDDFISATGLSSGWTFGGLVVGEDFCSVTHALADWRFHNLLVGSKQPDLVNISANQDGNVV